MSRTRDIAAFLSATEAANTDNNALLNTTSEVGLDSAEVGAIASASALTVYDSIGALPTTSLTAGDQAYITSSSRLYLSNGSGWYNVALINATPTLSISPNGTIELSSEGVVTVITATATDSDNADANLVLSIESGGDFFKMATVSQDSSVFTITPRSSDSATTLGFDGSSTLTFKASDGISFGSEQATFTLAFNDPDWYSAELILAAGDSDVAAGANAIPNNTAGGQGASAFLDRGIDSASVTYTGNPVQIGGDIYGYFSSEQNNPNTSSLAHSTDFNISGDVSFTVEGWWKFSSITGEQTLIEKYSSGPVGWSLYKASGHNLDFTSSSGVINTSQTIAAETWYHIAVCRDASTNVMKIFVNGVEKYSGTYSVGNDSTTSLYFGSRAASSNHFIGQIHDIRYDVGVAHYTEAFTPPKAQLESSGNTELLCFRDWNIKKDYSSNARTLTLHSYPVQSNVVPYGNDQVISPAGNRGIATVRTDERLMFAVQTIGASTGATLEMWARYSGTDGNNTQFWDWGKHNNVGSVSSFSQSAGGDDIGVYSNNYGSNAGHLYQPSYGMDNFADRMWHHFVLARAASGSYRIWIDGVSVSNGTGWTGVISGDNVFYLCGFSFTASYATQWDYADVRIVEGDHYDVSNSSITPPTSPVGNTSPAGDVILYVPMDNIPFFDKTGKTTMLAGDYAAPGDIIKFGPRSMAFTTNNDDRITIDKSTAALFGPGNFTFETWVYFGSNTISTYSGVTGTPIFECRSTNNTSDGFNLRRTAATTLQVWNATQQIEATSITMLNTWVHIAVSKVGSTTTLYVDGVAKGTSTNITTTATTDAIVGNGRHANSSSSVTGGSQVMYMEDLAVYRGRAKYTEAFTPPTESLGN